MQNPSDPDATNDGYKGLGHRVQVSETCRDKNDVRLITCAIPERAQEKDLLPEELIADTLDGSDGNVQCGADIEIHLSSLVAGPAPKKFELIQ